MSNTVHIAKSSSVSAKKYHTGKCAQYPDYARERTLDELGDDWEECGFCAKAHEGNKGGLSECSFCGETVHMAAHLDKCEVLQ